MRIRELLEGKSFNDLEFVNRTDDGDTELAYDLAEDLVFYLNNNDDVYRRFLYPTISNCVESIGAKKDISPNVFKRAVEEAYKRYIQEFPIKQLPSNLEKHVCEEVCKKLHDDLHKDYSEGKYKD